MCRRAHTVTALVLIAVGLFYVSIIEQTPDDTLYNVRRGVVAVVIVFILIGVIHMPDGPFVRPHPVVWRLVLCILILYVLLLIFALFQVSHIFLSLSPP
jgi:phosphatidylserine synthase 2